MNVSFICCRRERFWTHTLGAGRLSYQMVLRGTDQLYLNNQYRLERLELSSGKIRTLTDARDAPCMVLDGNGETVPHLVLTDGSGVLWKKDVSFEKIIPIIFSISALASCPGMEKRSCTAVTPPVTICGASFLGRRTVYRKYRLGGIFSGMTNMQ